MNSSINSLYMCLGCKVDYQSNRSLSLHLLNSPYCNDFMELLSHTLTPINQLNKNTNNNLSDMHLPTSFDKQNDDNNTDSDLELGYSNSDSKSTGRSI